MSYIGSLVKKLSFFAMVSAVWLAGAACAGEAEGPVPHMIYFFNPTCRLCTKTNEIVSAAEKKYAGKLSHERMNTADPKVGMDNLDYLFTLLDTMEVPEDNTPLLVVFLGQLEVTKDGRKFTPERVFLEGEQIEAELDAGIADYIANFGKGGKTLGLARPASFFSYTALASAAPDSPPQAEAPRPTSGRVKARAESQLRFGAISAAALADSINPCAFATIIILVAMMSSAKRTKNEIIIVCLAYTVSVYVTYFCIGLFLYKVIAEINSRGGWYLVAADLIYYFAFALCALFAVLSFRDAWLIFSGRSAEEMTLQLPKAFKKRINVAMARGVRARWLVVGVFMAGVTVSFLEAACTGQVYLPTILLMAETGFWQSMMLLAWYNLLFVLPLLIVFGLVLFGVTSQQLAAFFKKNIAWAKVALAVVFVLMGAFIWFEMYWPPGYRG